MSDNIKIQDTDNTNEWINWIEEAIDKEHLKYYEYKQFSNLQQIGAGAFGKVYRANWKNSEQCLAIKSFFNLDNITMKEIVRELKIQRKVDFHDNIIRCQGITKFESENNINNYMLVMEYANGGSLKSFLKENFNNLTWDDKYNMAHQLACAISCLHNEDIIHRDLHSGNILIHKNVIKLADFGLSKRIGASSNSRSKLFGVIAYVDPKIFSRRRNNNNQTTQIYSLNKKSDIYSVGVLLWEISSGKPPFYVEGEEYDVGLAVEISQGLREAVIPDTPEDYVIIYTKCWDGEPNNRPTIIQVVDQLKEIITKTNIIAENIQAPSKQELNTSDVKATDTKSELQGELSQLMNNFNKMNTEEIESTSSTSKQIVDQNILSENDLSIIVDDYVNLISEITLNKGMVDKFTKQHFLGYINKQSVNPQEIYNWLCNNQNNNSNSAFLLGYFNYYGIGTSVNDKKAFNLFVDASKQDNTLAQYFVGICYYFGRGTTKNGKLAFEYYKKVADKNYPAGQNSVGYCYFNGEGIKRDYKKAVYWFEKAANNGNMFAMNHLGYCYEDGFGVEKDNDKAIYWYKKSAEQGYSYAKKRLERLTKK